MRDLVAQRVREGKTNAEIEAEFRAAYGDWILLSPPLSSWNGLIWLVPVAALAAGLVFVTGRLRGVDVPKPARAHPDADRGASRARRARGGRRGMTIALFVVLLLGGMAAVIAPLMRRPVAWPADPPDQRDDVARAVSSLRDLEFARAAGTSRHAAPPASRIARAGRVHASRA